ncbi:condensation domain-containing protein [Streptomyces sp. NPDC046984]|uniref:condensation domain-containing protein n=1 Tax=Streptomyces sp. NPDC046984 TaxID=3155138 RepID=UPI0033F36550
MTSPHDGISGAGEGVFVRELGAFERIYYKFEQRHTMNFMIAAEFAEFLTSEQVASALRGAQRRHPLLRAYIRDNATGGAEFWSLSPAPEIHVRVVHSDHREWNSIAAAEFIRKIDVSIPPLVRAVLVAGSEGSTILLNFSHVIADGMSAVRIVNDVVAFLNGKALEILPTPPPQEQLIDKHLPKIDRSVLVALPEPSSEMAARVGFDSDTEQVPEVSTCTLDPEFTAEIVNRCKAEGSTVHGLLVAAFSQAYGVHRAQDFVRTVTPINIRGLIGAGNEVANYISAARTGSVEPGGSSIWDRARAVNEELGMPRSEVGTAIGSMAIRHFLPPGADGAVVEEFMNGQLGYEMQVSNIGVLDFPRSGAIHPTAVWGPMLLLNIAGEVNSGITTFGGRLRIVTSSRAVDGKFLDRVREILAEAVEA